MNPATLRALAERIVNLETQREIREHANWWEHHIRSWDGEVMQLRSLLATAEEKCERECDCNTP